MKVDIMLRCISQTFLATLMAILLIHQGGFSLDEAHGQSLTSTAMNSVRYYEKRPEVIVLPTGCQRGFGPQYRSFDPDLGNTFQIAGSTFVDFNPVRICAAAANICLSELSGMSCCKNACMQQHSGREVGKITMKAGVAYFSDGKFDPTGIGAIFDPEGYSACEANCVGVPTVPSRLLKEFPGGTRTRIIPIQR